MLACHCDLTNSMLFGAFVKIQKQLWRKQIGTSSLDINTIGELAISGLGDVFFGGITTASILQA